jgi:hypothetical protein
MKLINKTKKKESGERATMMLSLLSAVPRKDSLHYAVRKIFKVNNINMVMQLFFYLKHHKARCWHYHMLYKEEILKRNLAIFFGIIFALENPQRKIPFPERNQVLKRTRTDTILKEIQHLN